MGGHELNFDLTSETTAREEIQGWISQLNEPPKYREYVGPVHIQKLIFDSLERTSGNESDEILLRVIDNVSFALAAKDQEYIVPLLGELIGRLTQVPFEGRGAQGSTTFYRTRLDDGTRDQIDLFTIALFEQVVTIYHPVELKQLLTGFHYSAHSTQWAQSRHNPSITPEVMLAFAQAAAPYLSNESIEKLLRVYTREELLD